jgi:glutamine---fructose-6-phosphate transaminase (isomerizing)
MCGIFGTITNNKVSESKVKTLAKYSMIRGKDSSGIIYFNKGYKITRNNFEISQTLKSRDWRKSSLIFGHSRLITNGMTDNQPVYRDRISLLHNGIIVNESEFWNSNNEFNRLYSIDSEAIIVAALAYLKRNKDRNGLVRYILSKCEGAISAVLFLHEFGEVYLFTNTGSLYYGFSKGNVYFSSEEYPLIKINCKDISQVNSEGVKFDVIKSSIVEINDDKNHRKLDLIPTLGSDEEEKQMLVYENPKLKRCTKCILPETMPFITFDNNGVCNYCLSYIPKNHNKSIDELKRLVDPYKNLDKKNVLVPLSGGRDSCYTLHLAVKELGLNPIAYTYEWGMVTDIARRNISRITSQLGVEHIIVAADTEKKRINIKNNLLAWLKKPHLGMVNILMAGDKHFFKFNEVVKKQNKIKLELWGVNSLEKTHFKTGFLGLPPLLIHESYYITDIKYQIKYQALRIKEFIRNPSYINSSLFDTLSGEYYRSIRKKRDYFHVFDYMNWDEKTVDETLSNYGFETAIDTKSTWRIGDGTAAFYNYIYYTVAGFSEHDTFRSNQIREGLISREVALRLVSEENKPRYENIKWYLEAIGLDFIKTIKTINSIVRLY